MNVIIFTTLLVLTTLVSSHGRLITPLTRVGHTNYENDPVQLSSDDFVCRHADATTPQVTLTPGGSVDLEWNFSADHVGDCAVYVSYDVNLSRNSQRYFKIANFPKCKDQDGQTMTMNIPDWLPAGQVVVRWDWYALHVRPTIEFYDQCFDAIVTQGSNSLSNVGSLTTYTIAGIGYPANANTGVGYRNAFNQNTEQYMTGPPCANGYTLNKCHLTAEGTTGYLDVGDDGSNTQGGNGGTGAPEITTTAMPITYRCGLNWEDANNNCRTECPGGDPGTECPGGQDCYADLTNACTCSLASDAAEECIGGYSGTAGGIVALLVFIFLFLGGAAGVGLGYYMWQYEKPAEGSNMGSKKPNSWE